ncbi:MAG: 3D domain-containing protein [Saprospiraceae bacterium]|nr:3D domain-containing protein [Pyrinomonadaceae bacterium]
MNKLVRGGVILSLIGTLVVFMYAQSKTETALNIANVSQTQLNNTEDKNLDIEIKDDKKKANANKKLVEKTVMSKAAGISKGSFVATAYCLRGKTAMGHGVRTGLIAADPRVLRLGSRINVGAGNYSGNYLVSDTGGKIKGKRLDIWMASCSEARRFGRRTVTVSSLGK